jgi:hypothetical protein
MTGHFTSYKHRTNHELATISVWNLAFAPRPQQAAPQRR